MLKANIETFLACDASYEEAGIVLYGAPFDSTTSYRPGTRFGSRAIYMRLRFLSQGSLHQDLMLQNIHRLFQYFSHIRPLHGMLPAHVMSAHAGFLPDVYIIHHIHLKWHRPDNQKLYQHPVLSGIRSRSGHLLTAYYSSIPLPFSSVFNFYIIRCVFYNI